MCLTLYERGLALARVFPVRPQPVGYGWAVTCHGLLANPWHMKDPPSAVTHYQGTKLSFDAATPPAVHSNSACRAEADPLLCNYYGNIFTVQLGTHPKAKDLKDILAEARKRPGFAAVPPLFVPFVNNMKSMFPSGPALAPGASKFLEDVKARAGEKSLLGKMATEFLAM
jgi:hypothetical protein